MLVLLPRELGYCGIYMPNPDIPISDSCDCDCDCMVQAMKKHTSYVMSVHLTKVYPEVFPPLRIHKLQHDNETTIQGSIFSSTSPPSNTMAVTGSEWSEVLSSSFARYKMNEPYVQHIV